jgi:hypothetical protein
MRAIGFGQNVTGGGGNPTQIVVTNVRNSGTGSLADAITMANRASPSMGDSPPQEIVIDLPRVAHSQGTHIAVGTEYRAALGNDGLVAVAAPMTAELRAAIERQAGPQP